MLCRAIKASRCEPALIRLSGRRNPFSIADKRKGLQSKSPLQPRSYVWRRQPDLNR